MKLQPLSIFCLICLAVSSLAQGGPGGPGPRRGGGGGQERPQIRFDLPILQKAFNNQGRLKFTGQRKSWIRLSDEEHRNNELVWRDGLNQRVEIQKGSSDQGQIIVLREGKKWHFFPESNEIQVKPARFEDPLRRLAVLLGGRPGAPQGSAELRAGATIAGIKTQLVRIRDPRGNEMMKLWIDPESGLVVKRELFDFTGRLIGSSEYSKIDFGASTEPRDFEIRRSGATVVTIQQLIKRSANKAGVEPLIIEPNGMFELDSVRVVKLQGGEAMFQSYVSDMGRLSMIVSSTKIDSSKLKLLAGKNSNTFVREFKGMWIVLIADTPNTDVERIYRSLKQINPPR